MSQRPTRKLAWELTNGALTVDLLTEYVLDTPLPYDVNITDSLQSGDIVSKRRWTIITNHPDRERNYRNSIVQQDETVMGWSNWPVDTSSSVMNHFDRELRDYLLIPLHDDQFEGSRLEPLMRAIEALRVDLDKLNSVEDDIRLRAFYEDWNSPSGLDPLWQFENVIVARA